MNFLKISIVTPSFNQGDFLEETILSVLNQNYPNLEYIIIDGGSTDNSVEIIKKYEKHLKYWVSEKDSGQSEAINKGIKQATGDIINWLNSDDLFMPSTLFKIHEFFLNASSDIGVIHGGTLLFNNKGDLNFDYGYKDPTIERFLSGMSFSQPSAFIRKIYIDKIGALNENAHYGMDYDVYSKLALVSQFVKVDECFSKYRIHSNSKSVSQNHLFINDWIDVFANILNNFNKKELLLKFDDLSLKVDKSKFDVFKFDSNEVDINWDLTFYYFLSYVLKSDYLHNNFNRAKTISAYINKHYAVNINADSEIKLISNRLNLFPVFIIKLIRRLKNN